MIERRVIALYPPGSRDTDGSMLEELALAVDGWPRSQELFLRLDPVVVVEEKEP